MAETPSLVTDGNQCGDRAASIASTAVWVLPSVLFLNPTGHDKPDANSRCTWLSVVRAPIAPQLTRSEMYWGDMTSRYSTPDGIPVSFNSTRSLRAVLYTSFIWQLLSSRVTFIILFS